VNSYYRRTAADVLEDLQTSLEQGLTQAEAARRLERYGPNELIESGLKSPWKILWEQFTSTMVVILLISALISLSLGELKDAVAVLVIVVINALLGFRQEYQAEQAMAALKRMAVPQVKVRREGHVQQLPARQLVPGDIILLEAGDRVPADARLLESPNLRAEEAALTGESEPVDKRADFVASTDLPLGDRLNLVYMGTAITYGRGQAVVTATGMQTELGHIASLIQSTGSETTPLQRRLDQLGKSLALVALGLVAIVFFLGVLRGENLRLLFLTSISMAVAAVPEGLPAVVTIALALGAQRMLRRKALIRRLPAVEGLGSVTVICSDKTGTLTENRMTVTVLDVADHKVDLVEELRRGGAVYRSAPCEPPDAAKVAAVRQHPSLVLLLSGGALNNDATLECQDANYSIVGDPTEGALLIAAARIGLEKAALEQLFPRQAEAPFDSERKRMTTVHRWQVEELKAAGEQAHSPLAAILPLLQTADQPGAVPTVQSFIAFTKGAVDSLLQVSDQVWVDPHFEALDESYRQRIQVANDRLAQQGMRVLGVAWRAWEQLPSDTRPEALERNLVFIGLVGMIDPARPEVKTAVRTCQTAGIRPIMITGDHPLTARYIAQELGFIQEGQVLTGQDLAGMAPEALEQVVDTVNVYARVSPEHKLRIVQALQRRGQIAAMTGDGVNDAPALKAADIGVAMGITGTDVAKEAADMVLLDDNFATIVAAVEEGRTIYDNIRKFIKYTMTSNAGEIWVMLLAPFLGMPFPLLPLQILWVNLVTDGLPGLALGVEPPERDVMTRPPYKPNENIFGRGMGRDILWVGLLMGLTSLAMGYFMWRSGQPNWQTMVFTTLTLSQMGNALALRSQRDSLFRIGLLSNRPMLGAVLLTFVLQLLVIYLPFLQEIFKTSPLSLAELALCLFVSTLVFWGVEIQKWLLRRAQPDR
jgi:Ca2+-transporting ATPase